MGGFRNSILAGVKLIRNAIQSPNYVTGVSGWSINKDGSAEFADALIRGGLIAGPAGQRVWVGPLTELPAPLDTYLAAGIVFQYGAGFTYYGILSDGSDETETGIVLSDGTIVPMIAMVENSLNGIYRFLGTGPSGNNRFEWDAGLLIYQSGTAVYADLFESQFWDGSFISGGNISDNDTSFGPGVSGGGAFAIGNGLRHGEYHVVGGRIFVKIEYIFGSTSNQGTGAWTFTGPANQIAGPSVTNNTIVGRWWYVKPASLQRASGDVLMGSGTTNLTCQVGGSLPTLGGFTAIGAGIPEAWLNGSIITIEASWYIQQ